uniref:Neurotransmitter-gated ion-channel transmembrane domain-containing protein n=1 Tax=Plectus sambesii TaxID=2011161 RepID=A0A914XAI1_9BILA
MGPFNLQYGSWSYRSQYLRYVVETKDVFLGDFFDNQEWLLVDALLLNGSTNYEKNETYSMVVMELEIRRQAFYYVFNLVIPTTLVSIVAVTGFHAPINSTSRRETKFRLGIMTLLSMAVMLLMLVDEMPKFARESIPGQRGSFSDVPLLGMFYISLIATISVCTICTSGFVHMEKYALRNQEYEKIPRCLRWLTVKSLRRSFMSLFRPKRTPDGNCRPFLARKENNNQSLNPEENDTTTELGHLANNTERKPSALTESIASPPLANSSLLEMSKEDWLRAKLDIVLSLIRDQIEQRERIFRSQRLPKHWDRVIGRMEAASLTFFLLLITCNLFMFRYGDMWY